MKRKPVTIKDILSTRFKVNAFYQYTQGDKLIYYIVVNKVLQLRIQVIDGVHVIDELVHLSQSYLNSLYSMLIELLSKQDVLTVILAAYGSANELCKTCLKAGLPKVSSDTRYATVPQDYYKMLVAHADEPDSNIDAGYYLIAVSDDNSFNIIGQEQQLDEVSAKLRKAFPKITITTNSANEIEICLPTDNSRMKSTFLVSNIEGKLVIRNLFTDPTTMGFVQLSRLLDVIESFKDINSTVIITDVKAVELYRLCEARNYYHIDESTKIFNSTLFNQVHCGYGTYKVV